MRILLLTLFVAFNLYSQHLYYQYDYLTHVDGREIEIPFEGINYTIYNGKVSPDGVYLAGFLVDSTIQENLEYYRNPIGIVDFFDYPDSLTVILYNLKAGELVTSLKFNHYPFYSFIDNFLEIRAIDSLIIINVKNGETNYIPDENFYDLFSGNLFDIEQEDEIVKIGKFDFSKLAFENFASFLGDEEEIKYIYDNNILLQKDSAISLVRINENEADTIKTFRFGLIDRVFTENGFFIWGKKEGGNSNYEFTLFHYNEEKETLSEYFTLRDIYDTEDIYTLSEVFIYEGLIYFLASHLLVSRKNIISYNPETGTFTKITSGGKITSPIGLIESD